MFGSSEDIENSYEKLKGHNNITYRVGGNARFNARSSSIDWYLANDTKCSEIFENESSDRIIDSINSILNLSPEERNPHKLLKIVEHLVQLPDKEFLKIMSKILKLTESTMISMRRLHYLIFKVQKIDENNPLYVKFCPYEPSTRLRNAISDGLNISKINANNIKMLLLEVNRLIDEVNNIEFDNPNAVSSVIDDFSDELDKDKIVDDVNILQKKFCEFISLYTSAFSQLEKTEQLYIQISKKLESISDILETEL
ncbi:MAG: hypothetical protein ACRCZI_03915 [Cetobacterium sp.]